MVKNILYKIINQKKQRLNLLKKNISIDSLKEKIKNNNSFINFKEKIKNNTLIKKYPSLLKLKKQVPLLVL